MLASQGIEEEKQLDGEAKQPDGEGERLEGTCLRFLSAGRCTAGHLTGTGTDTRKVARERLDVSLD